MSVYELGFNSQVSLLLSKSRILFGLQCAKRLWWTVHEPDAPELAAQHDSVAQKRGRRLGVLARSYVPGGVLIGLPYYETKAQAEATAKALADGASVVYEATFEGGGGSASVDILQRHGRGYVLSEVKGTLDVKEAHLRDVAVQTHVVQAAGLQVDRVEIVHLNRACQHPDLSHLFVRETVTTKIRKLLEEIPGQIATLTRTVAGPLPSVEPGAHCAKPYPCPFHGRCWPEQPEQHVSTLYRLGAKKIAKLSAAGIHTLLSLPDDYKASGHAKRQIRSAKTGQLVVESGLGAALAKLAGPLAFLDFETINPAVPAWPGCRPFDQVPVQLSCHVLRDGKLEHHEWLADGSGDPRAPFADALLAACEGAKTIVAYNASFEKQRIDALLKCFPERAAALKKLRKRVVDLLPIVRDHVYHPKFNGRFGLKSVLPALVPDLGYDDLVIHDGATAAASLERLLLEGDSLSAPAVEELRVALLAYCKRDTLAMVRLHERLTELGAAPQGPSRS